MFLELVIQSKKFSLDKTKLLDFQAVKEMKPVLLFWEVHLNTYSMKLKDHFMMLFVFWFKLLKTRELFMVGEILRFKWLLPVKN